MSFAALAGVVLNIRKHVACVYIWAVTDTYWTWLDLDAGLHDQGECGRVPGMTLEGCPSRSTACDT